MRSLPVSLLALTLGISGCNTTTEAPASNDTSAKPDGGDPVEAVATKHGRVGVVSQPANLVASATFWDGPPAAAVDGCVVGPLPAGHELGPPKSVVRTDLSVPTVKAGDVSVSLVTKARGRQQQSLAWDPEQAFYYAVWPGPASPPPRGQELNLLDVAGERVDVTVTGDVVPAFQASVVASADFDVVGSKPGKGVYRHLSAAKTGDLVITWSNANPSTTLTLTGKTIAIGCQFPASATAGVVPAAVFEQIASEAAEDPAECPGSTCLPGLLAGQEQTHVRAGDFDVVVSHATWKPLMLIFQP